MADARPIYFLPKMEIVKNWKVVVFQNQSMVVGNRSAETILLMHRLGRRCKRVPNGLKKVFLQKVQLSARNRPEAGHVLSMGDELQASAPNYLRKYTLKLRLAERQS